MKHIAFRVIVSCARALAALLRAAGATTQRTLDILWPFQAVLRRMGRCDFVVRAQGALFAYERPDLIPLKLALVGAHEYDVTAFLRRALVPGATFIDVGANIGYFTVLAGRRVCSGHVVAIEPSPSNRKALERSIGLNGLANVSLIPKAAWSQSGRRLRLHVRDCHNPAASSLLDGGPVEAEVETTTLDDLVGLLGLTRVDVIKVDVEGAEFDVVQGMLGCLRDLRPAHVMCALDHPDEANRQRTRDLLGEAGYAATNVASGLPLRGHETPRANVVFTRT